MQTLKKNNRASIACRVGLHPVLAMVKEVMGTPGSDEKIGPTDLRCGLFFSSFVLR
jgi:hypothetical protein